MRKKQQIEKRTSIMLKGGGHASLVGTPTKETIDALNTMVELAKKNCKVEKPKIVTELTPELADKIYKDMRRRIYDEQVSKKAVLHHLKQLKAQMGKKAEYARSSWKDTNSAEVIEMCMSVIDKKIQKINRK